jgi:3-hydroxybutyryl-CoA dehydrogenase
MEIRKVGVIGTGTMGSGIARVCAGAGYQTLLRGRTQQSVGRGIGWMRSSLDRGVSRGAMTEQQRQEVLDCLKGVTALEDLGECDLVIESIIEDIEEKKRLFTALDGLCPQRTILATNTSSLPVIEMAAATQRPDRVVGIHFLYPVQAMKLVEVVRTLSSGEEALSTAKGFAESLGKTVILVKDTPGFVFNRLLIPYLMDAIRAFEEGLASREDIDEAMKLGFGHGWGPLAICDAAGLDVILRVATNLYQEFREAKYTPPPLLRRMVLAGHLGQKSGKGFYDYE